MSGLALPRITGGAIAVPFDRAARPGELDLLRADGADLFELRLDLAGNPAPHLAKAMAASFAGHPLIATCRRRDEGGQGNDDIERLLLLAACIEHASAIDVELGSASILPQAQTLAENNGIELIVSRHYMTHTPELVQLKHDIEHAFANGAAIAKLVTNVSAPAHIDNLREALDGARRQQREVAVMGMGDPELAARSRVELARAGSLFVFGAADLGSAPGQPKLSWLAGQLRGD